MNLNDLATKITKLEGGSVSLGIGQVKEVMRLTLEELASRTNEKVSKEASTR
jgi:hypothetical protein